MFDYRATLWVIPPLITLDDLVHDADTVKVIWDQGTTDRTEQPVRLAGVHAPETYETGFRESRAFVVAWLAPRIGYPPYRPRLKWPLRLVTEPNTSPEPNERQSFVRWIGTISDELTGECLNDQINTFLSGHPEWGSGR
jgi:hypothetical protein